MKFTLLRFKKMYCSLHEANVEELEPVEPKFIVGFGSCTGNKQFQLQLGANFGRFARPYIISNHFYIYKLILVFLYYFFIFGIWISV